MKRTVLIGFIATLMISPIAFGQDIDMKQINFQCIKEAEIDGIEKDEMASYIKSCVDDYGINEKEPIEDTIEIEEDSSLEESRNNEGNVNLQE